MDFDILVMIFPLISWISPSHIFSDSLHIVSGIEIFGGFSLTPYFLVRNSMSHV